MANIQLALSRLSLNEGGYSKREEDAGGETFCGISRVYNPDWSGWEIIDTVQENQRNDVTLYALGLRGHVDAFLKVKFWDISRMTEIQDQFVAEAIFDCSVLWGVETTGAWIQGIVNAIGANRIDVDGSIGPATIAAINGVVSESVQKRNIMLDLLASERKVGHVGQVNHRPSCAGDFAGWYERACRMRGPV